MANAWALSRPLLPARPSTRPNTFLRRSISIGCSGAPDRSKQYRRLCSIYGAPLITPANTVVVPVRITNGFKVNVFEGATGRSKYTLATDYILPTYGWIPAYQPVLATPPSGTRLYYAGPAAQPKHCCNLAER